MAKKDNDNGGEPPVTIKKYANRRLYNTATSSYVTLDHLSQMVKDGTDFVVYDAKTGEDITRSVLTHIIVEEESKGTALLPISFLRHLISFYGDSLQAVVPNYLEQSMQTFARNQENMREYMQNALGGLNPFGQLEEMNKQNVAMFENAMKMFAPFSGPGAGAGRNGGGEQQGGSGGERKPDTEQELEDLKARLEAMQRQLENLSRNSNSG